MNMEEQKRITVVDDDRAIQDAVQLMLERRGYLVTIFSDGEPLLAGNFICPSLFILDKQLPGVDGLDICRYLKAQEDTKDIPVLMLSASPQIAMQAKAACADDFLEKPFKMQALREVVARLTA